MKELTLHYVEPVYIGGDPQPHYVLDPWVQPRAGEDNQLIDTRDGHGESQPVRVVVPKGSTAEDTPNGVIVRAPNGRVSFAAGWPPPHEGRTTPDEWYPA